MIGPVLVVDSFPRLFLEHEVELRAQVLGLNFPKNPKIFDENGGIVIKTRVFGLF